MIEQFDLTAASAGMYQSGYNLAMRIKEKICDELNIFNFESITEMSGGIEGQLYVNYKNEFRLYIECNGSSMYGVNVQVKDMNGGNLGSSMAFKSMVDSTHTEIFLNIVKHQNNVLFGFSDFDNPAYKFVLMFTTYNNDVLCCWLPTSNTDLLFYKQDGIMYWKLKTMLNISVNGVNKGLFRAFMPTDASGYCDIYNQMDDMYNINTGYPFTYWLPVTVNGIEFIPLNNYTLFKSEEGSV